MWDGNEISARATHPSTLPCDVAIVGGGIAGLSVALALPPNLNVLLLTKGALGESNTRYAQGGLAAAVGLDDTPELHLRDTVAAGAGLVDEEAAHILVSEAREAVAWLIGQGAAFDERAPMNGESSAVSTSDLASRYQLGREAAHSRWRVLHAHGDATGAEIERALVAAVRARPGTRILEKTLALRLLLENDRCAGLDVLADGQRLRVRTRAGVVLANGGAGQLWLRTSNPAGATADGLALAWGAGAVLADLEYAQFHPTVLVPPERAAEPFLISEAVRGEGAYLRNASGERFMPRYSPDAELAPRDVVARAILSEMLAENAPSAYLDLRHLAAERMRERFPTIAATCRRYGLDLARDLIPVAPAAHYFMGGVAVDTWARTTVAGLYAVGEVACTGVHGANRLASNSLLEGLVFGRRAARAIADTADDFSGWPRESRLPGDTLDLSTPILESAPDPATAVGASRWTPSSGDDAARVSAGTLPAAESTRAALRRIMWERVSLRRDAPGLASALDDLRSLAARGPFDPETANMLFAARAIATAAQARRESRGGHFRVDYPDRVPARDGRHTLLRAVSTASAPTERLVAHVNV